MVEDRDFKCGVPIFSSYIYRVKLKIKVMKEYLVNVLQIMLGGFILALITFTYLHILEALGI